MGRIDGHQSEAALESKLINKLVNGGYQRGSNNDENELKSNFNAQLEKYNQIQLTKKEFNHLIHL